MQHVTRAAIPTYNCSTSEQKNYPPLQYLIFRGSIPHPMQLLCTLRDRCRKRPRNTRYQADANPYLGRTYTGWIAPARGRRTHSITSSARPSSVIVYTRHIEFFDDEAVDDDPFPKGGIPNRYDYRR
jgi:hypothetical protein